MENKITPAEEIFCMYKLGREGSFMTALIDTIFRGDIHNQAKLAKGYPDLVEVIQRYGGERGYWPELVNRWNQEFPTHKLHA